MSWNFEIILSESLRVSVSTSESFWESHVNIVVMLTVWWTLNFRRIKLPGKKHQFLVQTQKRFKRTLCNRHFIHQFLEFCHERFQDKSCNNRWGLECVVAYGLWKVGENYRPFSRSWKSVKTWIPVSNWGPWKFVNVGFCQTDKPVTSWLWE